MMRHFAGVLKHMLWITGNSHATIATALNVHVAGVL